MSHYGASSKFKGINNLSKANTFPISWLFDIDKRTMIIKKLELEPDEIPTKEEVEATANFLECLVDDLFVTSGMYTFAYYKGYNYMDIISLDIHALQFIGFKKQLHGTNRLIEHALERKNFHDLFLTMNKKILFDSYIKLFDQMPDNEKFGIFIDIYTRNEYGFTKITPDFFKEIVRYQSVEYIARMSEELEPYIKDGKIEIYRGEGTESTSLDKTFSWSVDKEVAIYFAKRHEPPGILYVADVDVNKVAAFLTDRSEKEILVHPENVENVYMLEDYSSQSTSPYSFEDIFDKLEKSGHMNSYNKWSKYLKPSLFHEPKGIHGLMHCKRVLFLSSILSYLLKLDRKDQIIMYMASVYHDIGRTHDWEDEQHGYLGYEKAEKIKLINLSGEEKAILKYVIDNHCITDERAVASVSSYSIKDQERAVRLLKVFKDADGLDRVRLGDLDISYLRNIEAKRLRVIAEQSLQWLR